MSDCLFCKIVSGQIKSNIIYEDDDVLAFDDINPRAPVHKLIIPKKHIATINDIEIDDQWVIGKVIYTAQQVAKQCGVDEQGYRLVFNCNEEGGQEVYHIHCHLLAGRAMQWPPG